MISSFLILGDFLQFKTQSQLRILHELLQLILLQLFHKENLVNK